MRDVTVIRGYWKRKIQFRDWYFTIFWTGKVGFILHWERDEQFSKWQCDFSSLEDFDSIIWPNFAEISPFQGMKKSNYASAILSGNAWQCRSMEKGPGAWAPNNFDWQIFNLKFGQLPRSSRCSSLRWSVKIVYLWLQQRKTAGN